MEEKNSDVRGRTGCLSVYVPRLPGFSGLGVTWVRLVYAFLTVFTAFAGVFVYLLMWIVIPKENN